MGTTSNAGLGHGCGGAPQGELEEYDYINKEQENADSNEKKPKRLYRPSPKHKRGGWGSLDPIQTQAEGQELLDSGYSFGKQIYNVMSDGTIIKFQPDNTPSHGYHAYRVSTLRDIPTTVLRKMLSDGKITKSQYNKLITSNKRISGNEKDGGNKR